MLQGNERARRSARKLRREMTLPEVLLWQKLKSRPRGLKFRRQQPAGPYILDFYCHEARLIVEIDGIAHDMSDRPAADIIRDEHFAQDGFRIMRISASTVLQDVDEVAESIIAYALREDS